MVRGWLVLVLVAAAALSAFAQRAPDVDFDRLGPKIGEAAPDFEAPDQDGSMRRLSWLLGPKGAMLVFYRSADW